MHVADTTARWRARSTWVWAALLCAGLLCFVLSALIEWPYLDGQPWSNGLLVLAPQAAPEAVTARERAAVPEGAWRVAARFLPADEVARPYAWLQLALNDAPGFAEQVDRIGLLDNERLLMLHTEPAALAPALASGRLPEPDAREVLAGRLARHEQFELDGHTWKVVGRLHAAVSGLAYAYVFPASEDRRALFDGADATQGFYHPSGLDRVEELVAPLLPEKVEAETEDTSAQDRFLDAVRAAGDDAPAVAGGRVAAPAAVVWLSTAGKMLVVVGMLGLATLLFRGWASLRHAWLAAPFAEIVARPRLWWGVHALFLLAYLLPSIAAVAMPLTHHHATSAIALLFSEGDLSHIGDALLSGNVVVAAFTIWYHNYIYNTVLLTVVLSLVIPLLGWLKTAFSLALAGFVLAPLNAGFASGLLYHSITIGLELVAYNAACFFVLVFWLRLFLALADGEPRQLVQALRILAGGTVLIGAQLLVAGCYETITLMLFR